MPTQRNATQKHVIAIMDTARSNHTLYMNGRSRKGYNGHRIDYFSYNGGQTWSNGSKSALMDDASGGTRPPVP